MPDKGKIMSQTYYEKQSWLLKLYRESYERKEMDVKKTIAALRIIGFSETIAATRVKEWDMQAGALALETEKDRKYRQKEIASLEKYVLRTSLGRKKYEEYISSRSK